MGAWLKKLLVSILAWIVFRLLGRTKRRYLNAMSACKVACYFDVWGKITGDRVIDVDDDLYTKIRSCVDYYFDKNFLFMPKSPIFVYGVVSYSLLAQINQSKIRSSAREEIEFARKHAVLSIIAGYSKIYHLMSLRASEAIAWLESRIGEGESSTPYWKRRLTSKEFSHGVDISTSFRRLNRKTQKLLSRAKTRIGEKNRPQVEFSISSVSSFLGI